MEALLRNNAEIFNEHFRKVQRKQAKYYAVRDIWLSLEDAALLDSDIWDDEECVGSEIQCRTEASEAWATI